MSFFQYEKDQNNIVTLLMDDPGKAVNVMNDEYAAGLEECVSKLEADLDNVAGVIVASGKSTFFAGGNLDEILAISPENCEKYLTKILGIKNSMRRLENIGKPVVCAINGAALGGGYEICLGTHHRIAVDSPKVVVGLPEVTLGLLPGGGGVVRLVRLLGLQQALPLLLTGSKIPAQQALEMGLIDQLVASTEDLIGQAKTWILDNPESTQPWDKSGYEFPGGGYNSATIQQYIGQQIASVKATKRGLYPASQGILSAAVESMQVDFDTANVIETRYLTNLAQTPEAKNLITYFFQTNDVRGGASRPADQPKTQVKKIGILGAGMMGAGIAYVAAKNGLEVILKDVSQESADRGKSHSGTIASKLIARGKMSEEQKEQLLALITPTESLDDFNSCDLVIEAVFENRELKASVTKETELQMQDAAIFASNTSTLPITGLATAYSKPENFIGLHFFSPVDRMQLVEIIMGEKTSDETLAKAYDFCKQIKKLPIVVNDSRDFYTSRVYESYCDEGAWLLSDGVKPVLIENCAKQAGMPAGPLASVDAVSQKLIYSIKSQAKADLETEEQPYSKAEEPPYLWVDRMVNEFDRGGKVHGAGYFEYPQGEKKYFWPKLEELQPKDVPDVPIQDIKDRILFRQSIEALRCLEEGVLRSVIECNIGSIMGIGFPAYTGGQLQYINSYGVSDFCQRAQQLAEKYGERFAPPQILLKHAETDTPFT